MKWGWRYGQRVLHNLAHKAKIMGMQLVPVENTLKNTRKINHLSGVP